MASSLGVATLRVRGLFSLMVAPHKRVDSAKEGTRGCWNLSTADMKISTTTALEGAYLSHCSRIPAKLLYEAAP